MSYSFQMLIFTEVVQDQEKVLLTSMKRGTPFFVIAKDLWPCFTEITPWLILCGLECDIEEEHTFEFRKNSSFYPLELNSAQRKKVTFWTSIRLWSLCSPSSYKQLIHSELDPHDLQGSTELFPSSSISISLSCSQWGSRSENK